MHLFQIMLSFKCGQRSRSLQFQYSQSQDNSQSHRFHSEFCINQMKDLYTDYYVELLQNIFNQARREFARNQAPSI
jgi:hypothetical protein